MNNFIAVDEVNVGIVSQSRFAFLVLLSPAASIAGMGWKVDC